jgi:hypothetical protein
MGGHKGKEALLSYDERERVVSTAVEIARLLNQTWPQATDDGILHYAIAGSLSVALLAGAGSYVDLDGNEVFLPNEVFDLLEASLHEIHDIDVENRVGPFPHTPGEESDRLLDRAARLLGIESIELDVPNSVDIKAPAVVVVIGGEMFYVTRLDYQVGFKVLNVFFNYNKKADQLNHEVPRLIEAAVTLYGEEYIWGLIGYFFALNDEEESRFQRFGIDLTTDHLFDLLTSDNLVCAELKKIMRRGMKSRSPTRPRGGY